YMDETGLGSKSQSELESMMKQCAAFDEARIKKGQWLMGIGLQCARTAKTLRAKAGQVLVTDGPFAETKEHLGGVVVLAFKDFGEALATLSQHPALRSGVVIEIRPINDEVSKLWEAKVGSNRV